MKNKLKISSLFLLLFLGTAQICLAQNLLWAKQFGGIGNSNGISNSASAYFSQFDSLGNLYTTGIFSGTIDFDPGPGIFNLTADGSSAFVIKLNPSGNFMWAKKIGGSSSSVETFSLVVDNIGNIFVSGRFQGTVDMDPGLNVYNLTAGGADGYITKLDSNGNFIWAKQLHGDINSYTSCASIKIANNGDIVLVGEFHGVVDFDTGNGIANITSIGLTGPFTFNTDAFVLKLNAQGATIWTKIFGGVNSDSAECIFLDTIGNIYVNGQFQGPDPIDLDPGPGQFYLTSLGVYDTFITKLDAAGNFIWAKQFGGSNDDFIGMEMTPNGTIYLVGQYGSVDCDFDPGPAVYNLNSPGNAFIAKYANTGNLVWAKSISGMVNSGVSSIVIDASENVYVVGYVESADPLVDFDPGPGVYNIPFDNSAYENGFLLKLNQAGDFGWAKIFYGSYHRYISSIINDSSNNLYLTGGFSGSLYIAPGLDSFSMISGGEGYNEDGFIYKFGTTLGLDDDFNRANVLVFPNPVHDQLSISCTNYSNAVAELYNLQGQLLQQTPLMSTTTVLSTSNLAQGIYVVHVKTVDGLLSQQVIKQ
ncbi:MAG: hypothetical protein RL699_1274 [Bacteroidota bacterium]|jgi:uncharacterized protein (DUF2249 family)